MEIDEIVARVLRQYWVLLLVCVMLPLGVVASLIESQPAKYVADARIATDSTVPGSSAEADAAASQVRALATSRGLVVKALADAHATRDITEFASKQITVTGLGTSPIVDLTVTDHDPKVAQKVDETLANEVAKTLNKVGDAGLTKTLKAIDDQLVKLSQKRAHLAGFALLNPNDVTAQSKLAGIDQLMTGLEGSRSDLVSRAAADGRAVVVDAPVLPTRAGSNGLVQKAALAGLLGLVVGVLLAALAETLRPTVPGAARVARRLDVPLLGELAKDELRGQGTAELYDLERSLRLAARRAGVQTVVVAEAGRDRSNEDAVAVLEKAVAGHAGYGRRESVTDIEKGRGPDSAGALRRVCRLRSVDSIVDTGPVGLVVLAGPVTRLADVVVFRDLVEASGWPLLGVVGVQRWWKLWTRLTGRGGPGGATERPDAAASAEPEARSEAYAGPSAEGCAR